MATSADHVFDICIELALVELPLIWILFACITRDFGRRYCHSWNVFIVYWFGRTLPEVGPGQWRMQDSI